LKRLAALGALLVVLVVLGVAQIVLPGIAEQKIRDRLARSGTVLSVDVSAFPAIELLWQRADHVVVRMADYHANVGQLGHTLAGAVAADSVDASATTLQVGRLTLHDATLTKRGSQLTGNARITEADLRAAVPFIDNVSPVASGGGQLVLRGTATLFGLTASVDATVATQNGDVIVQPDVPFGGLATLTVFSNPHLAVENVAAGTAPDGFSLTAQGQLR
jgi:hypothetical protein